MLTSRVVPVFLAILAAQSLAQIDEKDVYSVQTHLGIVEAWRLAPEAVLRFCRTEDPDGDAQRVLRYEAWRREQATLMSAVERRFSELAPLVPLPQSGDKAVELARARVILAFLRLEFAGKSATETLASCKAYGNPDYPLWSEQRVQRTRTSLAALDAWTNNRATGRAP